MIVCGNNRLGQRNNRGVLLSSKELWLPRGILWRLVRDHHMLVVHFGLLAKNGCPQHGQTDTKTDARRNRFNSIATTYFVRLFEFNNRLILSHSASPID